MPKIGHMVTKRNRRIKHTAEARTYFHVRVRNSQSGNLVDLLLTMNEYLRAFERAHKNPEDLKD